MSLILCRLETPKRVLLQTVKTRWNAAKCGISSGTALFAKKKLFFREIKTILYGKHNLDPYIYTMDHPDLTVPVLKLPNIMENLQMVKKIYSKTGVKRTAGRSKIDKTKFLLTTGSLQVLHTVQINFHAVDVNKYRYIQTPIGLLIF